MSERRDPCPKCGRGAHDRTMATSTDTGLFYCHRCGFKGGPKSSGSVHRVPLRDRTPTQINDPAVAQRKRQRIEQVWGDAVPLDHRGARPVRRYLESRALGAITKHPPAALRAHPALSCWEGTTRIGVFPAMVARLDNAAGEMVTLHTTFLRADGCAKASIATQKKIMSVPVPGATKGSAIRLYEARGGVLGIAEGIESALSLHLLQGIPVWSAYCADNLVRVHLPRRGLRKLYVAVDLDESGVGEKAAIALASRVAGWASQPEVYLVKPNGSAPRDLNDEIRTVERMNER